MKHYLFLTIIFLTFACKEEPIGQQPIDNVPPGAVSDVKIENTSGGAILTYELPKDEDLLYVKAVYFLKEGVQSESRSSMYSDTLKIAGFGDTQQREVSLIAVDRSRNESEPVIVTIQPLEPAVISIGRTLNMVEDFGGVCAYWNNPTRAEVSVVLLKEDHNNEYVPIETFYSTMVDGEGAKRGMDTIAVKFGIFVQDRWENRSETKYFTVTPLYETRFDPLKFKEIILPTDERYDWGWVMPWLWDGKVNTGFHTSIGTGRWPHWFTFDLGIVGKVSRLITYQRTGTYLYAAGNIKTFEIWGCTELDPTGAWDNWTFLGEFKSIKPSGLPLGTTSAEDVAYAAAGEEYTFSPMNPKVRYIRVKVTENWSGTDYLHIMEMHFYGDNRGN